MVVPAYNEGPAIRPCVERILAATSSQVEVLVVYDRPDDTTATPVAELAARDPRVRGVLNQVRRGLAGRSRPGSTRRGPRWWWSPWRTAAMTSPRSTRECGW